MKPHTERVRRQQWPAFGIARKNKHSGAENVFVRRDILLQEDPSAVFQLQVGAVLEHAKIGTPERLHYSRPKPLVARVKGDSDNDSSIGRAFSKEFQLLADLSRSQLLLPDKRFANRFRRQPANSELHAGSLVGRALFAPAGAVTAARQSCRRV